MNVWSSLWKRGAAGLLLLGSSVLFGVGCGSDDAPSPEAAATTEARQPSPTASVSRSPTPRRAKTVSLAHLTAPVTVPPLAAPFAAPRQDPRLLEAITKALEGTTGTYSVVAHHLVDGRAAAVNEDHRHHTASLFKLAVLAAVHRERDQGRLDFQRLLTLDDWYVGFDLGTLERLGLEVGDRVTVADALKAMIVISDTSLALLAQDAAGSGRVKELIEAEGMSNTSQPVPPLATSAADMARLLRAIGSGKGFTEASRTEMLGLLLQESIRAGIAAGIPDGTPLAHKTGNLEDATHDVGIVWGPTGPYVIAILSDQPWTWEPLVRVSTAVYDYLALPASPLQQPTVQPVSTPAPPARSPQPTPAGTRSAPVLATATATSTRR